MSVWLIMKRREIFGQPQVGVLLKMKSFVVDDVWR